MNTRTLQNSGRESVKGLGQEVGWRSGKVHGSIVNQPKRKRGWDARRQPSPTQEPPRTRGTRESAAGAGGELLTRWGRRRLGRAPPAAEGKEPAPARLLVSAEMLFVHMFSVYCGHPVKGKMEHLSNSNYTLKKQKQNKNTPNFRDSSKGH